MVCNQVFSRYAFARLATAGVTARDHVSIATTIKTITKKAITR
jgi:hypothetical protein